MEQWGQHHPKNRRVDFTKIHLYTKFEKKSVKKCSCWSAHKNVTRTQRRRNAAEFKVSSSDFRRPGDTIITCDSDFLPVIWGKNKPNAMGKYAELATLATSVNSLCNTPFKLPSHSHSTVVSASSYSASLSPCFGMLHFAFTLSFGSQHSEKAEW